MKSLRCRNDVLIVHDLFVAAALSRRGGLVNLIQIALPLKLILLARVLRIGSRDNFTFGSGFLSRAFFFLWAFLELFQHWIFFYFFSNSCLKLEPAQLQELYRLLQLWSHSKLPRQSQTRF